MRSKLSEAIKEVVEEGKYDLVLNYASAVIHAAPTLDITSKVTEKLNQKQ